VTAVEPVLRELGETLAAAVPSWWTQARLVMTFPDGPHVIVSPEGHDEPISLTPRMMLAVGQLAGARTSARLTWTGAQLDAVRGADGTWTHTASFVEPAAAPAARAPVMPAAVPPSFPPASAGLHAGSRQKVEALVRRAEGELAAGLTAEALGRFGEALAELPGDAFGWAEAGWLYTRMASVRLGTGDAAGAVRSAQHALKCAGWADEPRALLRLGQALAILKDADAPRVLAQAHRAGGHDWFAQLAPDLLPLIGQRR
jgi:hypothetical protein